MTGPLAGLHVVEFAERDLRSLRRKASRRPRRRGHQDRAARRGCAAPMGPVSRGSARPRAFRLVRLPQRRQTRRHPRFGPAGRPGGRPRTHRAGACAHRGFRAGDAGRLGLGLGRVEPAEPKPGAVAHLSFWSVRTLADRRATPLTVQAVSGWISTRDPDRPPVQAGARISEYVAGAYGALGALTALRLPPAGQVTEVDVSELEALLSTLPYPMLMARRMQHLGLPTNAAVGPHAGCRPGRRRLGRHQLPDGPALAGRVRDARPARVRRASDRDHDGRAGARRVLSQGGAIAGTSRPSPRSWNSGQALRIPAAPVNDGATVFDCPQYAERGFFVTAGGRDWSFQRPGPAFRFSKTPVAQPRPAPRLGTRPEPWATDARSLSATDGPLPFSGLRVLDLTTFWAGAYLTCYLGAFGADIVKVESIQRPDGHRYSGAFAYRGRRLVRAQPHLAGHQPQQARPHPGPDLGPGPRHRPTAGRGGRRGRGELLAAGGRAVRAGLRRRWLR